MARDDSNWAKPVKNLEATDRDGALNANVRGRKLAAANGGFGRLYQKTFTVRLEGANVTPQEVIRVWKTEFATFWPKGQKMFLPATGIAPGEVGLINATLPGAPTMATGILVIYADDESFSFMSPEGHPFAGPLTFSAHVEDGVTVVQAHELTRASDPLWELMMMMPVLGERMQNDMWRQTLRNLAQRFGVDTVAESKIVCVDSRRQWRNAKNAWQNAGVRSGLSAPLRWARRLAAR
ncbi:MAG TPA: hypothetical protein VIN37_01660 [Candidatus Limnocylindria bacterium]|jgi:hypothetical protein